jgi:hypothetical protein
MSSLKCTFLNDPFLTGIIFSGNEDQRKLLPVITGNTFLFLQS